MVGRTLGHAYAASAQRVQALNLIEQLKRQSKQRYVSAYDVPTIYAGLRDKDQAIQWLETTYGDRFSLLIWLHVEPLFDGVHHARGSGTCCGG